MASITLKKDKDGNQIFEFDDQFLQMFKQNPSLFNGMIDSLKEKDVKLKREDVNLKKQETAQKITNMIDSVVRNSCKTIMAFTQNKEDEVDPDDFEDIDSRSDEEVAEDIKKNYTFANGEINLGGN